MKFKKALSKISILFILLISFNSCHHYKIGTVKPISAGYIAEKEKAQDYLNVHMGEEI